MLHSLTKWGYRSVKMSSVKRIEKCEQLYHNHNIDIFEPFNPIWKFLENICKSI